MPRLRKAHLLGVDLKETILDAAETILAAEGFRAFTMEDLADGIGIAKGTTYLYFSSKEEVALGVIERSVGRVLEELKAIATGPGTAEARLREMLIARVLLRHRNVAHYDQAKLADLLVILREGLRQRRQKYSGSEIAIFSGVIADGIQCGEFLRCDPEAVATAMFWASEGLLPSHVGRDELGEIAIVGRISVVARLIVAGMTVKGLPARAPVKGKGRGHSRKGLRLVCAPLLCGFLALNAAGAQTPNAQLQLPLSIPKVDSIFARYAFDSTPGCVAGVDSGSRSLARRAYGQASLELGVPNSPGTVYYGASLAKQFTATAILLLEQHGKLKLSDPIRKHIPELSPAASPVTLEQLLQHTSGLRDYPDLVVMSGSRDADRTDFAGILRLLSRQRSFNFPSGTDFSYNNGGYVLLAEVVRRVTGAPLRDFASTRIFQPVRMGGTQFVANHAQLIPNRATGHRTNGKEWQVAPYIGDTYGDGGLFTTVDDLLVWARNLKSGSVGGRQLVERITKETVLPGGKRTGFALGLEVRRYRGRDFLGHGGRSSGAQNYAMTFPSEGISIVVLCNARDIDAELYARRIAASIFPPLPASVANVDTSTTSVELQAMKAVEGTYLNAKSLGTRRVEVRDGKLVWVRGDATVLRPQSSTRFRFPDVPGALVFSEFRAGRAQTMTIVPDVGEPTPYERIEPFVVPKAGLAEYSGSYFSDEVQGSYEVAPWDSALSFQSLSSSFSFVAFPMMKDGFRGGEDVLLAFQRDRRGQITGFAFSTSRAKNVVFIRRSSKATARPQPPP